MLASFQYVILSFNNTFRIGNVIIYMLAYELFIRIQTNLMLNYK